MVAVKIKKNLKTSLERQEGALKNPSEPEMAVDVLNQEDAEGKPIEQALIVEHIFRKPIEESIPSGIAGFDIKGHQIYVNQVFCEMVGWHEEELFGAQYPFKYWPPDDMEIAYRGRIVRI